MLPTVEDQILADLANMSPQEKERYRRYIQTGDIDILDEPDEIGFGPHPRDFPVDKDSQ